MINDLNKITYHTAIATSNGITTNVIKSLLVGILIVSGAFWSRLNNSPQNNTASTLASETSRTKAFTYQKEAIATTNHPENKIQNTPLAILEPDILEPGPSSLAYEEIPNKTDIYASGIQKYRPEQLIITDTNRASLTTYAKNLINTVKGYPFYINKSPTEITLNLSKKTISDQTREINLLKEMSSTYKTVAEQTMKVQVPNAISSFHTDLANSLDRTAQLIDNMVNINNDKLLALNSARQYITETKITLTIIAEINKFYADKDIIIGDQNRLNVVIDAIN